jgi:hypothetical protein
MVAHSAAVRSTGVERLTRELPSFSATKLASGMQAVASTVMSRGAVVITRHERPSMVLMSFAMDPVELGEAAVAQAAQAPRA